MQHTIKTGGSTGVESGGATAPLHELESSALISHIQTTTENQKALLARELHDELGGLLVGAVMDLAWAEQHLTAPTAELRQKLVRARHTLSTAIDLKRKLIEDLRPTLLDNVGLFAALRWHVQAACNIASMTCSISLPDEERRWSPHVPIALFRIVQEAFAVIVAQGQTSATAFSVTVSQGKLAIRFVSRPAPAAASSAEGLEPHALAAVRQRTQALGGSFSYGDREGDGIGMTATFPLESMLAAA